MDFTQWSSMDRLLTDKPSWVPEEDMERIASYGKYDAIYWNDPTQYSLRVLEGEQPLYIPNARTVVDTTASFVLKGLKLKVTDSQNHQTTVAALKNLLDREMFYTRFHIAKHAGVARGDYVMHMTANPSKPQGSRISLNSVDPSNVFPIYDDDEPDRMVGCHLAQQYYLPEEPDTVRIRRLTYRVVEVAGARRITREEAIFQLEPHWYGEKAVKIRDIYPLGLLPPSITAIPVYWFKNRDWDGQLYGSSELRGLESLSQAISQSSTDINSALALEGLGVYATDGGRPVDDSGSEVNWEVAPGRVMEVPTGSYFRRVEGVGSITPAKEHIDYMENKLYEGASITDISLGKADVAVAQSGIALAIKFMPTLAKIDERDIAGIARLTQLFYDWKLWHQSFELETLDGEIVPEIGDKLPTDRTSRINELNNMMDRRVISRQYYREEVQKLGYVFPSDMADQVAADMAFDQQFTKTSSDETPSPDDEENQSNNKDRPNESSGTEQDQDIEDQARGGKPQ